MKIFRTIRNYLCYCGIEKEEYRAVKKEAYISNFKVWRILNFLMIAGFSYMFIASLFSEMLAVNRTLYLIFLIYSVVATLLFFVIKKESIIAQFLIYLSIVALLLFGVSITQNKPDYPAVTFIVMMLLTPMFMIDKPYFMGIVISIASAIFLIWMHGVKPVEIWRMDLINTLAFAVVAFFIHVIANSIRIKEFVLTKEINIQKDVDDLTGLKNKGALTRAINSYLGDKSMSKGIMFLLDIDHFKAINDTYGHDVGDDVIGQLGSFLGEYFTKGEIVGRFGGDEFIFFIKDTDDALFAEKIASEIVHGVSERIILPDRSKKTSVSIGIALYHGAEKNYSEIFKKADMALYEIKADRTQKYKIYE